MKFLVHQAYKRSNGVSASNKGFVVGRPPTYDKDILLGQIINCLWEGGYAATAVSDLVQATGIKAASLYALFGSKKGMMLAALDRYAQETFAGLRAVLDATPPGAAQMRAVLEHAWQSGLADPRARGCFLVNSIMEARPDVPEFTEAVAGYMEILRAMLRDELARTTDLLPDITPEQAALSVQMQVWSIKLLVRLHPSPEMGAPIVRQTLRALFTPEALRAADAPQPSVPR